MEVPCPQLGGGNSNIFYFHPEPWGDDPIWRAYFSNGLVQPPTRQDFCWDNSGCFLMEKKLWNNWHNNSRRNSLFLLKLCCFCFLFGKRMLIYIYIYTYFIVSHVLLYDTSSSSRKKTLYKAFPIRYFTIQRVGFWWTKSMPAGGVSTITYHRTVDDMTYIYIMSVLIMYIYYTNTSCFSMLVFGFFTNIYVYVNIYIYIYNNYMPHAVSCSTMIVKNKVLQWWS